MATLDELWLQVQQQLVSRAAHEVKGALNGVAVNLEVVRSRAGRDGVPASDVAHFATSAGEQLAQLIRMTEAVLGLSRSPREVAEVAVPARQAVTLLDASSRVDGGGVELTLEGGTTGRTSAPPTETRLIVGAALLAAAAKGTRVNCLLTASNPPSLRIHPVALDRIPAEVRDAVAAAGIRCETDGHGISIVFPPPKGSMDQIA